MEVDFDGLRIHICDAYNRLCTKLSKELNVAHPDLTPQDIAEEMEELRMGIGTLMGCYTDGTKQEPIKSLNYLPYYFNDGTGE